MARCISTSWLLLVMVASSGSAADQMQYPLAATVGHAGEVFVADRELPGVWRAEGGKLSLFFQGSKRFRTPLNAVRCLAIDRDGSVLAGDTSTREVYRFDKDSKPAGLTSGGIGMPMGIAVTSQGDLLVSDLELHRIFKVPSQGGKAQVFAEVRAPRGICVDSEDRLWVVSHDKDQLVRVLPDGKVQTVVEGRPFQFPHGVAVGADNWAYVTDGYAKAVWRIAPGEKPQKWISGEPLVNPVGIVMGKSGLLVVDPHAKAVFQIDASGKVSRLELAK
jgi:sugar lactone lactonase YvrE